MAAIQRSPRFCDRLFGADLRRWRQHEFVTEPKKTPRERGYLVACLLEEQLFCFLSDLKASAITVSSLLESAGLSAFVSSFPGLGPSLIDI
jgi:hypothetical protein